jgi:SAM-dependent methyltransferase
MTVETTVCLLCGASDTQPLFTLADSLLGLPGTFYLVRCADCGLVYQNPRPTQAEIGFYYPSEYDPFAEPPWAISNPITRIVHLYGLKKRWKLVERWAPRRSGRRRILDVGCAKGSFLAAGSADWDTVGVELTEGAAQFARSRFGLTVHQGTVEEVDLPAHSFDVITMWDVLEHVYDPCQTLKRIHDLLRPDGVFIARVPNLDAWEARFSGRYWAGLDQPRHIFVPDEASLRRLLHETSFLEVNRQCLSGSYNVLMLSWRFWLRQHARQRRWRQLAQRALDNLATRAALTPLLWVVDKVFKKGPLLTFVAQPVRP